MLSDLFYGDCKVVRDSVHGYIAVPSVMMREIVDSALFQRLRHIEQTSMRPLFPAARHDRFIHSLGVFHLGCRAFDAVRRNAESESTVVGLDACSPEWWDKQEVLFAVACLLHDCAHAAFSHTYEDYYGLPSVKTGELAPLEIGKRLAGIHGETMSRLDAELVGEYLEDQALCDDLFDKEGEPSGKPHERMSALMIRRYFGDSIERVFAELNATRAAHGANPLAIEPVDFALMARMVIGCAYRAEPSILHELQNCFIALLNSSIVDVDGLDYMMRDTLNSGISNRNVDYDRLLEALTIRKATRFDGHAVSHASFSGVWLTGSDLDYRKAGSSNAELAIRGKANFKFEDADDARDAFGNDASTEREHPVARLDRDDDRKKISGTRSGYLVHTVKPCDIALCDWSGKLTGVICTPLEDLNLGGVFGGSASCTFFLAYGKASVSVLLAASDARNTFHQWVYAHPLIVYYSSFLQNYLLKMSAKYLCCLQCNPKQFALEESTGDGDGLPTEAPVEEGLPPMRCLDHCPAAGKDGLQPIGEEQMITKILGLEGFFNPKSFEGEWVEGCGLVFNRSSDDDLNFLFKWVYFHNKGRGDKANPYIEDYFAEYFSRPHHYAVWKSHADYLRFKRKNPHVTIPPFEKLRGADQSMTSRHYVFIEEGSDVAKELIGAKAKGAIAIKVGVDVKTLDYASILIAFDDGVDRLIDVVAASALSAKPEPMLLIFKTR